MLIVGGVHLITDPVAIFQAFKIRRFDICSFVYIYFGLFLLVTVLLFPPDIFTYVIMFGLLTIAPILISLVIGLFKTHEK